MRDVVARIGVADIRAFGLTCEDCEHLLPSLNYSTHVSIVAGSFLQDILIGRVRRTDKVNFINKKRNKGQSVIVFADAPII